MVQWVDLVKQTEILEGPPENTFPVSLSQARKHCSINEHETSWDSLLEPFMLAAEKMVEGQAEIDIREKTKTLTLARWPLFQDYLIIRFETRPVSSIEEIRYYDEDDSVQVLASSKYEIWLGRYPPWVTVRAENVPTLSTKRAKAVEIDFKAGVPAGSPINPIAELAILELTAFWFTNREAFGRIPTPADGAQGRVFQSLIDSLRWRVYP